MIEKVYIVTTYNTILKGRCCKYKIYYSVKVGAQIRSILEGDIMFLVNIIIRSNISICVGYIPTEGYGLVNSIFAVIFLTSL